MDMQGLLSTVLSNLNQGQGSDTLVNASLNLANIMEQGISFQTGQTLVMSFDNANSLLSITTTDGKNISISPENFNIDRGGQINTNEPVVIEARINNLQNTSAKLQLISINHKSPQRYIRQQNAPIQSLENAPVIIQEKSTLQNIPLENIKIVDIARPYVEDLPIPIAVKNALQQNLQQLEIKVQINNLTTPQTPIKTLDTFVKTNLKNPVTEQITSQVSGAIQNLPEKLLVNTTQTTNIIQQTVQTIKNALLPLEGTTIPAIIISSDGENALVTDIGKIRPEIPISLPDKLFAELKITDIITNASTSIKSEVTSLDKVIQSLQILKTEAPQLYTQIISKLPTNNDNMLSNMVNFARASEKGDISIWLGQDIVQQLSSKTSGETSILHELQNALQESHKQTPIWRTIEIPYYVENHLEKIRLSIKQYPDEDDDAENTHQKFGTRFVVDTNFSILGAFQFDAFSFAKDRRFDLVIRTERNVGNDLCANIMRIFKTTLNDVQYTGNIKINLKENFIKIGEDNTNSKSSSQDIFI